MHGQNQPKKRSPEREEKIPPPVLLFLFPSVGEPPSLPSHTVPCTRRRILFRSGVVGGRRPHPSKRNATRRDGGAGDQKMPHYVYGRRPPRRGEGKKVISTNKGETPSLSISPLSYTGMYVPKKRRCALLKFVQKEEVEAHSIAAPDTWENGKRVRPTPHQSGASQQETDWAGRKKLGEP